MPSERGQSAVVVPVAAVEPLVSAWRQRFDSSAAQGMPAHITVLVPFLREDRLTDAVLARLGELCGELPVLEIEFRRTARFPAVLYLDPEPSDGLRALTSAIAQRWPETPPYGGEFAEVIPHLTVAHDADADTLCDIEADLLYGLPVRARLTEACLYVFDGARWQPRAALSFQTGDRE
jgi:2'-5' RNA ligase